MEPTSGPTAAAHVSRLRSSPVKGLAQDDVEALTLLPDGIRGDRRFVCADERLRRLYTADLGPLARARAAWDEAAGLLAVTLPDGLVVQATVELAPTAVELGSAFGRPMPAHEVRGPLAGALSAAAGRPLRLFQVPVGFGSPGPVTLLGDGSVERLAAELGVPELDARRFKMSVELAGLAPHAEDGWGGAVVRLGDAEVLVGGPVPRCVVTTRDPDTLARDHDTLRALLRYRGPLETGEPPFGVYATVVRPGVVRLGDRVLPVR